MKIETRKCLGRGVSYSMLFVTIVAANLISFYVLVGIVLGGNWDKVNGYVEKGYSEFFDN